jgi:hypothetical protein
MFARVRSMLVRPWSWVQAVAMAAANWLLDCACLAGCIPALHGAVPCQSILVVYAMTEIAASISRSRRVTSGRRGEPRALGRRLRGARRGGQPRSRSTA